MVWSVDLVIMNVYQGGGYDGDEHSRAEEEGQGGGYTWMD